MPIQEAVVAIKSDTQSGTEPMLGLGLPVQPYLDELYIPPLIRPSADEHGASLRLWMHPAEAQLHSELGKRTAVWVYRQSPDAPATPQAPIGPTIEVQQGQCVRIDWHNALSQADGSFARHPVVAVRDLPKLVRLATSGAVHAPENLLGFTLGRCDRSAAHVPPWTIVHLHGARVAADYDGWPETAYYPGQIQHAVYTNAQSGTLLWYHDHAMAITRLNVYAGLAGLYIVRDPQEAALGLPRGVDDYELPLLIQDRCLTLDSDHPAAGADQLLHKVGTPGGEPLPIDGGSDTVEQAPMEFFGPLMLVNGRIWPRATVRADVYRLRILNGANARTFRLRFTDAHGQPVAVPLQLIGSDSGLLAKPIDLHDAARPQPGTITLMPAERVDVLIDFRAFSGQRIELRNSAKSPFDGTDAGSSDPLADFLPHPHVMCFDVGAPGERHELLAWDQALLPSATPWSYAAVRRMNPIERLVALVENDQGMLELQECAPLSDTSGPRYWDGTSALPPSQLALRQRDEHRHRLYRLLPGMFSDSVNYLARDGDVELWKLLNLSEDTHQIHLHLVHFKLLAREAYTKVARVPQRGDEHDAGGYATALDTSAEAVRLDPAELGWKDTIRVDPAQLAIIAVPFRAYAPSDTRPEQGARLYMTGRYMYHCHILEHEDYEMMRPFVVMPPEVIDHMHQMGSDLPSTGSSAPAPATGWYMSHE